MIYICYDKFPASYKRDLYQLLVEVDNDFVPMLSHREGIGQTDFKFISDGTKPIFYFESLREHSFILAIDNDTLVGFLAYTKSGDETSASYYISTVAVKRKYRGQHVGKKLYDMFFAIADHGVVTVRTWSTNEAQLGLFESFKFHKFKTIKNDRGIGIDTLWYRKKT